MRTRFLAFLSSLVFFVCIPFNGQTTKPKSGSSPKVATSKSQTRRKVTRKSSRRHTLSTARLRRAQRAFVASSDLRPMAQQLLENPSSAAYAGVEAYARKHASSDVGALAWLSIGYARYRDQQYPEAIAALKKAELHAGEVRDYAVYFLGSSYMASGDAPNAVSLLHDFDSHYPDSPFSRDAVLTYAQASSKLGDTRSAVLALSKIRTPIRADIELAYGRALLDSSDSAHAVAVFKNLYFSLPLAQEADTAGDLLKGLPPAGSPSFDERKTRADLLAGGGRYGDAAKEYRQLLADASDSALPQLQFALARALYRGGDDTAARQLLEQLSPAGEQNAERLYYLVELARNGGDEGRFNTVLQQLREQAPNSRWLEQALLSAGNMYLLKKDYDRAIDFYRELSERFPRGTIGPYAHWKAAWLALRQGRTSEAKQGFEEQIARYPDSSEISAALYWRARLAEEDHDTTRAWAWYQKLLDRFPNYYYSALARERVDALKKPAALPADPLLEKIPAFSLPSRFQEIPDPPANDLRFERSRLLQNAALYDFAARELQSAAGEGSSWAVLEMARMYTESGNYFQALRALKRAVPAYFSVDLDALPRPYWQNLFPRAYWDDLKRFASGNNLDPYLVASLIRQESEFNPQALSRANARGLMQLLPSTAKSVAREMGIRFSTDQLFVPTRNLQLGMRHFRELLDHFNGQPEYALAAYNAGANRVDDWLSDGKYRDVAEFVESIPFTQTREYVQAIMRNATVYRQLYSQTSVSAERAEQMNRPLSH